MSRYLLISLCFLTACGSDLPSEGGPADTGVVMASDGATSSGAALLLGTGETEFLELREGQVLPLILGPQGTGRIGGYHVWGGVETRGLDASARINLKFNFVKTRDGQLMADSEWNKMLQPAATGAQFYALPIIVRDCCSARNELILMSATATDQNGLSVTSSVTFQAGPKCSDAEGNEICP